ncbi:DNA polymerase III subunit chi [Sphingomonas aracearum]|uniref:DNA polymerase III subunit chi n=1 Tax=Sphingomonas aracearum TaxID=2283317 RepID=A0A369VZ14_9SPHN|nr:DNA polymerase III subunit chi [Sphingomonas aracearum]RDE06360.1 DNA polymerase III subunit chi [Sphingomonas aracearum]
MQVDFYHLTQAPLDRVLPRICERVLAGGGRLLIVSESDDQRARLDKLLWTYEAESFLPHGQAGEGEADQPVLLVADVRAANHARNVALADGIWREEALAFDRAFHFFDEDRIGEARAAWKGLADREGVTRNYWKQDENGRWQKAA